MADRRLEALRQVAAIRVAQRVLAERGVQLAMDAFATAQVTLADAGYRVDAAFTTWRGQADSDRFLPDVERHHAAQLIARAEERESARIACDRASAARVTARQALTRADAAVEQSGMIVRRLARRDRMRREERQLVEHADRVTQRWGKA